ncbi:MAG: hypothetical protein A4E49_00046 [Methanosaeta sp. PtaU1.Bin112]|nr:MAG: hypothetical protein A4E49_00046 [Methanosaeta sp. PtaU1.Bin112]
MAVEALRFYSFNGLLIKGIDLLSAPAVFCKVYQLLLNRWNINALLSDYVDNVSVIPKEGRREAKLLPNAPGLLNKHFQNSGIKGIAHNHSPYMHLWNLLAVSVDPAVPLLQAVGVPGKFVMDHDIGHMLEVNSLADAVGGDEDAFLQPLELVEPFFSLRLVEFTVNCYYLYVGFRLWEPPWDLSFQIIQSILIASEYDYLGGSIISCYGLAEKVSGELSELTVLGWCNLFS